MMTSTKRVNQPMLSGIGEQILAQHEHHLHVEEDLARAAIRNYLSDLHHFAVWCESTWKQGQEAEPAFRPGAVTTPTLTDYQTYLQQALHLKLNSVNRSLISLKRYFAWLLTSGHVKYDPAKVMKLVGEEVASPHHLNGQEEQAFSKHNKHQANPLNATAHTGLLAYDPSPRKPLSSITPLFLSEKRCTQLIEPGLGYLIKKYADRVQVSDVSSHDLRHRFGHRMVQSVPLHRLAQLMGHDSLDTTLIYIQSTKEDLQQAVEAIAWK